MKVADSGQYSGSVKVADHRPLRGFTMRLPALHIVALLHLSLVFYNTPHAATPKVTGLVTGSKFLIVGRPHWQVASDCSIPFPYGK